ncbi:hypothetical protein ES705_49618 [subsurface metagenome]
MARLIVKEKTEELDEREDFPHEWLEEQIIEGKTYLDTDDYTGTSDIKDGLVSLVKDEVEVQAMRDAFHWLFEEDPQ